jgi:hypothetical protein
MFRGTSNPILSSFTPSLTLCTQALKRKQNNGNRVLQINLVPACRGFKYDLAFADSSIFDPKSHLYVQHQQCMNRKVD